MSNTPVQEHPAQGLSSGSGQTLPSRPLQSISDPSASKRVCFYKSGDYKFSGHRMVINARTFKTFDALLDALSKKVPLPFGVRTITTPRGTHVVRALDDLQDGGAYVCSDQKRVKPLNLNEVNRRQVPWNTTRPLSARQLRRRGLRFSQFKRRNEVTIRPARVTERAAVRTPKRLEVIKNRDPTVKRTIVLQKRTAPTFDALLDYLSHILQFPVLKLYSLEGRRVDGLSALILCSGVVVAAGNEPFRLGNLGYHRAGQVGQVMYVETEEPSTLQLRTQKNKSFSSGRGSRNFSLSSERYIVNQINKSQNGSMSSHPHHHQESPETEVNQRHMSVDSCGTERVDKDHPPCILPQEDDIEKSFRVNQDGSMTVEMKVHLTIKEEEMLHWTTTLSRTSLSKRTVCASASESGNSSPDSNNAVAKASSSIGEDETKEENHPAGAGKDVGFYDERMYEGYTSSTLGKSKTGFKRTPTPGPRHVNKKASVESVKMVTQSGVQESTLGHYSYMERTADGETTEGYCVVRHSSSSSNRPIPKPRKTASAGASNKCSSSSLRSAGVAEVLQIQNNGMEVTETVMHIYESQGCYDNYVANEDYSVDGVPLHGSTPAPESKPSTDSGPRSSSNDCDIDCSWQPPTADSLHRQKEEMLSLSSESVSLAHKIANNLSSGTENEAQTPTDAHIREMVNKDKSMKKKKVIKSTRNSSTSTSGPDKKTKEGTIGTSKNSKHSSAEKISSDASVRKKSLNSSESAKSGQKSKGAEKKSEKESKKSMKDEKKPKDTALLVSSENVKKNPPKRQAAAKYNGHNVNSPTGRPQMKKNISDILQTKKSNLSGKKTVSKPKSMTENTISSPKMSLQQSESISLPSLNPSPSEIHQYVENWLENVSPEAVPYTEEAAADETEPRPKVVFQIGGDSESDEKSECKTNLEEYYAYPGSAVKKSVSCLSVPLYHEGPATTLLHTEHKALGLCVSMPSVRVDPAQQESRLRSHKSAENLSPADSEASSSNMLSPKAKIKPVLRQLCSSIQCIRRASDANTTTSLEKSHSLPDFPTQVASVFGSSCKAFLSFLSVVTLNDTVKGSAAGENSQSRTTSEAMLMMESLQKISAIEDEEEQRASLTDLQSRASSQMRERWKDFQILRERLESEPLSPKVSETEFALDVASEGGDVFGSQHSGIDELMEELNMPQDLREEIVSAIQYTKSFYPAEESTFVEPERNQSDSEEDVEQFVRDCNDETKLSPEPSNDAAYNQQTNIIGESNQEPDEAQELQTEREELFTNEEKETEENREVDQVDDGEGVKVSECEDLKEMDDDEGNEAEDKEREEKAEEEAEQKADVGSGGESVEKVVGGSEEEMTADEEEMGERLEGGEEEEMEEGLVANETREGDSVEETDEREGVDETEEEMKDEPEEEAYEEENREEEEEEETEKNQGAEISQREEEEVDENAGEEKEVENAIEEMEEQVNDEESDHMIEGVEEEAEEEVTEVQMEVKEIRGDSEELDEEEEVENKREETEEEEEEEEEEEGEADPVTRTIDVEEKVMEETDEEAEMEEAIEERNEEDEPEEEADEEENSEEEEEEEEIEERNEEDEEQGKEEEKEEITEVVIEENNEEEEDSEEEDEREHEEEEEEEKEEDIGVKSAEDIRWREVTDEEVQDSDKDTEEEDEREHEEEEEKEEEKEEEDIGVKSTEDIRSREVTDEEVQESDKDTEKTGTSEEEESTEEKEVVEELAGQVFDEEEGDSEEEKELNEELDQAEKPSEDEAKEGNNTEDSLSDDKDCKNELEEASCLQPHASSCEEENAEPNAESPTKYSYEGSCEDDKGNGTDTVNELDEDEARSNSSAHPAEISQELLDFVNYALQSSSLIFTYDTQGNIRIEPDNARVVQTPLTAVTKIRKDSSYGLKRLPSPNTSDLSDYRPETSESGGYKSQESVDIVSESGEEAAEKPSPVRTKGANVEQPNSKLSYASNSKSSGSFSSSDSGTKASRDLSYFSAASSLKADAEAPAQAAQCISFNSTDGVLIDRGRWLLKENHLIRKSPPVSLGMYDNLDSTSMDTGQDNNSEDSPPPHKIQTNPLTTISSSELEEMAKPQTPKCSYFNMPHGSDSDPFLDESSVKSGKKDSGSVRGRGFRVSPTIDTSKTWTNKNGSLSSFASVEFKIPDRKVHPEGESSAVTETRRTSGGGGNALRAQDSLETLHLRCGQYCPIL